MSRAKDAGGNTRAPQEPLRGSEQARRLAEAIHRERHAIERRWLELVQQHLDTTGVEPTQLRDGLPDYLEALVELLSKDGHTGRDPPSESAWWKVAREHAITRVRIGFDISQLIREFILLRQVIGEIAGPRGVHTAGAAVLLADILEAGMAAAVQAYVEARDFEARRRQAEHIGFLTHELRNPLATATIAASQLRAGALPEQMRLLDILDRSHSRLSGLVDSVLLTEKLEAGKVEPRPSHVKLDVVMGPALEGARAAAAERHLELHASYDADAEVELDPLLTRSAVENLVDNAVRYTDSGEVDVEVDNRPDATIIHVRDTCPGISAEELKTIFEPFHRGTSGKPGTGLGLAIAKRAVEAQGGSIHAESTGPNGCHFWIELPKRAHDPRGG